MSMEAETPPSAPLCRLAPTEEEKQSFFGKEWMRGIMIVGSKYRSMRY
jgi:hypothetical protein